MELWQIDDSQPAVRFNVVSSPNAMVKQATQRKEQGELSDSRKRQLKFWSVFREKLDETGKIRSLQTARPQYWFDVALGKSGVHLSNTFNTDRNEISARVYIQNQQVDEWLPFFEEKKSIIEAEIGHELVWNPNPENRDKVILLPRHFDLEDEIEWSTALAWLVEKTLQFRKTFSRLIQEKKMR